MAAAFTASSRSLHGNVHTDASPVMDTVSHANCLAIHATISDMHMNACQLENACMLAHA